MQIGICLARTCDSTNVLESVGNMPRNQVQQEHHRDTSIRQSFGYVPSRLSAYFAGSLCAGLVSCRGGLSRPCLLVAHLRPVLVGLPKLVVPPDTVTSPFEPAVRWPWL